VTLACRGPASQFFGKQCAVRALFGADLSRIPAFSRFVPRCRKRIFFLGVFENRPLEKAEGKTDNSVGMCRIMPEEEKHCAKKSVNLGGFGEHSRDER